MDDNKMPTVVIVVPCYNEQEVLPATASALRLLLNEMIDQGQAARESRVLLVDDGSTDSTWEVISSICDENKAFGGIKMSANRGHQNALLAGIEIAVETMKADAIITIDADLQDDPTAMKEMLRLYSVGYDIVLGVRQSRKSDTWFKRTTAQGFYRLMQRLGVNVVYNHADYRLISRRVAIGLQGYQERNMFLRGVVAQMGFRQTTVLYDRSERAAGESKYPLGKMINFAIDGITSFSVKPVRMIFSLGLLLICISLFLLVYVLVAYFTHKTVSGWSSLMLSLWFIGGCLLLSLGVIGEYIAKIYLETKHRPRYHLDKVKNIN